MKNIFKFCFLCFMFFMLYNNNVNAEEAKISTSQSEEAKISTSHSAELLQMVALAEAQDEGLEQVALVMQTIMNRVEDENFPNTVEEVVSQKGQFSTYANGSYYNYPPNEISKEALLILPHMGNKGQTFFCNKNYSSWHDNNLKYVFKNKNHKYYTL